MERKIFSASRKTKFYLLDGEEIRYQDSPHVFSILGKCIISGIFVFILLLVPLGRLFSIVPFGFLLYFLKKREKTEVVITNRRITIKQGILNQEETNIELYKISDTKCRRNIQSLLLRLLTKRNVANIHCVSNDHFSRSFVLEGIENPEPIYARLMNDIQKRKLERRPIVQDDINENFFYGS